MIENVKYSSQLIKRRMIMT